MAGSKTVKKSIKHIRLFLKNFNGITIPWKTIRLNTLHHSLGIYVLCGTRFNSILTAGEKRTLTRKMMSNTLWATLVPASNTNENFGKKQRGGVLVTSGGNVR